MDAIRHARSLLAAVLVAVACAVFASGASATVTATSITSPPEPLFSIFHESDSQGSIAIAGTASARDGDRVDIRCYRSPAGAMLVANVPVNDGTFAVANASLGAISGRSCRLRAVPAGSNPPNLAPFNGPATFNSHHAWYLWSGKQRSYYVHATQREGAFDHESAGGCGVAGSYLHDPVTLAESTFVFACNQFFDENPAGNGMNLTIDGANAYAAQNLSSRMAPLAGFRPVSHTLQHDAAAGDAVIGERQELMTCGAAVHPPTAANCSDLAASGVRLERTVAQHHDGLMTRVTDVFTNTSPIVRSLSVGYGQELCMTGASCSAPRLNFAFPAGQRATAPPAGTEITGPLPESSTIAMSVEGAADGDAHTGRAAITFFPASDGAKFRTPRSFDLFFKNRMIAPGASFITDTVFSQAFTQARLDSLIADAGRMITPQPSVTIGPATLRYNRARRRLRLNTGRRVACPIPGRNCATAAKVTATIKFERRGAPTGFRTVKLGAFRASLEPGGTTAVVFTLNKTATKLFRRHRRLTVTLTFDVTAGQYAAAAAPGSLKLRAPRQLKPNTKRR